jgi:2-dehydro-3-deoxyphosphogluconate aldolase/(4S)-4-hydroxy-2-oxoglutarate aldolase
MDETIKGPVFSWARFAEVPVVGILRNISLEEMKHILPLYLEAGMTTVEITMNTDGAEDMIRYAVERYGAVLNIGAGTVCDRGDLAKALGAGAQFVVTPIVEEEVISACVREHLPVFPGAFTPTEVYRAWKMGADVVKVFPAGVLGPGYIKELKGPLDRIRLLPTGGVHLHNCIDFLDAGAEGLGMGGHLFDRRLIGSKDWVALKAGFEGIVGKLRATKRVSG